MARSQLYTTSQAAAALGVSRQFVLRLYAKGAMKAQRTGRGFQLTRASLEKYAASRDIQLQDQPSGTGVYLVGFSGDLLPEELLHQHCPGLTAAGYMVGRHGARAVVLELATVGHREARQAADELKKLEPGLRLVGVAADEGQVGEGWKQFDRVLVRPSATELLLAVVG